MNNSVKNSAIIVFYYVLGASAWIFFSDRMLGFLSSTSDMVYLATIKGMLFIGITGSLLYMILRRRGERDDTVQTEIRTRDYWPPLIALVVVVATVGAFSHLIYRSEAEAAHERTRAQLRVDAGIQARAAAAWLTARNDEVWAIAGLPLIRNALLFAGSTADWAPCAEIERQRERLERVFKYSSVVIRRADGRTLCNRTDLRPPNAPPLGGTPPTTTHEGQTVAVVADTDGRPVLVIRTPILGPGSPAVPTGAEFVVELRLDDTLFPFLRSLVPPGLKDTMLLIHRSGDGYAAMFEREGATPPPAEARWSAEEISRLKNTGEEAGHTSHTLTYRGRAWTVATDAVAGIDWLAVAAVEVGSEKKALDDLAFTTGASLVIGFGASLIVAFILWQRQNVRAARIELEQTRRAQFAERLYTATFEAVNVGIVHISFDGRLIRSNAALSQLSGYGIDRLRELDVARVIAPEDREAVMTSLGRMARGEVAFLSAERLLIHADGRLIPVAVNASVVHTEVGPCVVATVEDITARRQAEALLKEMEASRRLEALGRMTGGIAHDFNNLLTIISGNLQMLEMAPDSKRAPQLIEAALKATEAGARLNQRLVTFARQRQLATAQTDVGARVDAVMTLFGQTMGPDVRLKVVAPATPCIAQADQNEVDNAILNLAINSRDAMPNGGTIEIETRIVTLENEIVPGESEARSGDYVLLRVTDTGVGMSPEVLARAFDPFFTTKEVGRGTGLGLAMLHGFVRQSGGFVQLQSEAGQGTTVGVHLPRASGGGSVAAAPDGGVPAVGHGERILVVEDHPEVRAVSRERISALGYVVSEAADAAAALALLDAGEAIDLVFSDIAMPGGMSGIDLARRLRASRPEIRVVLTTGYSAELDTGETSASPEFDVLRKPYSQAELAERLALALRRG